MSDSMIVSPPKLSIREWYWRAYGGDDDSTMDMEVVEPPISITNTDGDGEDDTGGNTLKNLAPLTAHIGSGMNLAILNGEIISLIAS
mmetsp:Transcript_8171/g.12286  ORF Transcript_8171/g.12286 Transcript_8171/m.12286 type:complete len:87 (-) Transcript_8171:1282-1542(-)